MRCVFQGFCFQLNTIISTLYKESLKPGHICGLCIKLWRNERLWKDFFQWTSLSSHAVAFMLYPILFIYFNIILSWPRTKKHIIRQSVSLYVSNRNPLLTYMLLHRLFGSGSSNKLGNNLNSQTNDALRHHPIYFRTHVTWTNIH